MMPPTPAHGPTPGTGPAVRARRPAPKPKVRWTWLEWFLLAESFIPALLFIPGISQARVFIRMAGFFLALGTWAAVIISGKSDRVESSYAPKPWLKVAAVWLVIMILHWSTSSPQAGLAQSMLYIAVFSPSLWAMMYLKSSRQLGRLMAILLICNGIASLLGLGQVFRPNTFNPPVIPGVTNLSEAELAIHSLVYTDQNGKQIIRPCGLSDSPGSASVAGGVAALVGMTFALRPIGLIRRLFCLGLAFAGVAVIYYSQVRMVLVMLVICMAVLTAIFAAQRNYGHAALLGGIGATMIVGALSWVMATSGRVVVERFLGLTSTSLADTYKSSGRALYVQTTLEEVMWREPLGQGLGRWGTVNQVFGGATDHGIWVEVMISAWVVDGGIPLLVIYNIAIALAMVSTLRIALRPGDRDVRFWAAVVFASNLSVIATCFSYVTFITAIGMQFWFLAALVHAADYRARLEAAARRRQAAPQPIPKAPAAEPRPTTAHP